MLGDTSLGAQTATVVATPRAPDAAELERGSLLGRYLVLAPLGAGGMGVVYAAFDPELDRKVALKLLRAEPASDVDASVGRARLVREAQALARLNHPNVVAIHDVGTLDDRVWLAIEYIDGQTLSDWLKQRPRRWREILAVLLDAGRGLAAAHAAGLVHRDLKPENIMIGSDGRVRVMDFGLARASGPQDEAPITRPAALARALDSSVLTAQVTSAGLIIGTPSYMAPEQWAGQALDARVDQFAFCVTLWEALFGERPYTGDTLLELANHIVQGERKAPVRRAHVPAWLHHALARGLHRDPDARFASMDALLAALASGQTRLRNRRIVLGLVMILLAALAALAWRHHSRDLRLAACDAVGSQIHDTWNDSTRAALQANFQATGVAFADTTYAKLVPWVDRWTGEWSERRRDLCRAQELDGADNFHDLSAQCLDEHREALAATLDTLVDSDASTVQEAVAMAIDLPRLAACSDPAALARRPAPPSDPELRARVDAVRRDLQRADELRLAGRYTAARELAFAAMPIAEQLAYPPLIARAAVTLGNAAYTAGDLEQAESALILAYTRAGVIGDDNQALAAASQLTYVVGFSAARHAEGLVWSHSAEMLLDRLGLRGSLREADHLDNLASIRLEQGQVDEALALFTRALELNEHLLSRDHPEVATTLNNLAASKRAEGDLEAAHALHLRALALRERVLRPDHPDITTSLNNLADVERLRGDHDQAFALNTRALAILERERGPDHLDIAFSLNNLALVHQERREYDQAIALQDRALQILERAYGSEHPTVATALNNLGLFHQLRGDLDLAEQLHLRTLALRERLGGPDQFPVGLSLFRLATIHRLRGEFTQAETTYQRALATWQKVLGADSPELAWPLVGQGQLALARGRPREAVPLIERALRLRGDDTSKPDRLAEARFALAKALVAADKHHDRSRVLALAQEAADAYRGFGDSAALAEVEAWSRTQR